MKNLQSKNLPFRTDKQYYQPAIRERADSGRKLFPQLHKPPTTIDQLSTPPKDQSCLTVLAYLNQINQARNIQRKRKFRHEQGWGLKRCSKYHESNGCMAKGEEEDIEKLTGRRNRLETLFSSNPVNGSIFSSMRKKIISQKDEFIETMMSHHKQKGKDMRFSFYNNVQKSQYILSKFRQDSCLTERATNKFQNTFNRHIVSTSIISLLEQAKEKLRKGTIS